MPRDHDGSFEAQLVPKLARRPACFNEQIPSPYARGMSVRDIRSGAGVSKPVYRAVGLDMGGRKDVLGLWIVACDGLKGLPEAITATWLKATVQICVIRR
nr:transposase [Streptomyces inhibens]